MLREFILCAILCPRLGAEWIGRISWLPRAPLGPIFMTGLYSVQSIVPPIVLVDLSYKSVPKAPWAAMRSAHSLRSKPRTEYSTLDRWSTLGVNKRVLIRWFSCWDLTSGTMSSNRSRLSWSRYQKFIKGGLGPDTKSKLRPRSCLYRNRDSANAELYPIQIQDHVANGT